MNITKEMINNSIKDVALENEKTFTIEGTDYLCFLTVEGNEFRVYTLYHVNDEPAFRVLEDDHNNTLEISFPEDATFPLESLLV